MKRVSCIKATYKEKVLEMLNSYTLVLVCFNKAIPFNIGQPVCGHAAVPLAEVHWLNEFMVDCQVSFENAAYMLRRKLFPFMHDPHPWVQGIIYSI